MPRAEAYGSSFVCLFVSQSVQGGTTSFRYVTRKRIITNIPIAHVIHRLYAGFLTDRHWTVVRNLKLRTWIVDSPAEGKQHSSTI